MFTGIPFVCREYCLSSHRHGLLAFLRHCPNGGPHPLTNEPIFTLNRWMVSWLCCILCWHTPWLFAGWPVIVACEGTSVVQSRSFTMNITLEWSTYNGCHNTMNTTNKSSIHWPHRNLLPFLWHVLWPSQWQCPSKHETSTQCWLIAGPVLLTIRQWVDILCL